MKSVRPFILISLSAFACVAYAQSHDDDINAQTACERNIRLPQGYEFVEFTNDCNYNENLTPVKHAKGYGYADVKGNIIIKPAFEMAYGFDEGLALIKQNGKYGFIDKTGNTVIKAVYDDAWGFLDGRANVVINGKYGFIDKTGKTIIKPTYDKTGQWFENGLVPAKKGDKWGYIDRHGKTIIAFDYQSAGNFGSKLAPVSVLQDKILKYGYINPKGDWVIKPTFELATDFINNQAMVSENGKLYMIDPNGNQIQATLFD